MTLLYRMSLIKMLRFMDNDILPVILKKLKILRANFSLGELDKIIEWLLSDRKIQQHRAMQAFITYLYQSYGDDYEDREMFVDHIKYKLGYCVRKVTDAHIQGERVRFVKYKPKSLSFASCSQKVHHEFAERLKEYALNEYGVVFEEWLKEWNNNTNTLQ